MKKHIAKAMALLMALTMALHVRQLTIKRKPPRLPASRGFVIVMFMFLYN